MKKIYLSILALSFSTWGFSQAIPCPGFETWANNSQSGGTFLLPQKWVSFDQIQNVFNASYTGTSVVRTTSMHTGSYAVLMQTAINSGDTMGGVIVSHDSVSTLLDFLFGGSRTIGFPYTTRSANLQFWYKTTLLSGDSAMISIQMSKWNTSLQQRDILATKDYAITTNTNTYTLLSIPLSYSINANPDTALIVAGLNGPNGKKTHVGTLFYLDDLAFTGTVPFGVNEYGAGANYVNLYPNPFSAIANISINPSVGLNNAVMLVYDVLGNEVLKKNNINDHELTLDKGNLSKGLYFYNLINEGELITTGKFVIE